MHQGGQTRRQILKAAVGGAAGIALGWPVRGFAAVSQAASGDATSERLSDNLFVVRVPGEANVVAQRLYDREGFVRSGREKVDDFGEDIVHYVRGLPVAEPSYRAAARILGLDAEDRVLTACAKIRPSARHSVLFVGSWRSASVATLRRVSGQTLASKFVCTLY